MDRIVIDTSSSETGPIVPNLTLLGAVGLKINFRSWLAWVVELGGGGIFPIGGTDGGGRGGASYGYTGLSFWLGGAR